MLTRTGFPEYVESLAIGPSPDFLRTQTDLCELADEFPTEVNAAYLWKKIATSVDPLMELREFTKHFLVDAPDFSEEYILHYVKKVDMLPPELKDQIKYEVESVLAKAAAIVPKTSYDPTKDDIKQRNFDKSRALQDDPSLLDKLASMMDSCKSSCNYFAPVSDKVGSIFDFSRMNSLNSSMPHDTELNAPPPTGLGLNIMNKIPRAIQDSLMQAYTSAKLLMDAAKEQLTSPGTTAKLREFARQGVSADRKGVPFIGSTGSSLFQDALGLNSNLMTKVKRSMGDCFRIADFLNRYNAFDPEMNLAVARKKIFKVQIPDASLGGEKRTWSGTAQGVGDSDAPGGAPYDNNVTPQYALKPQTTGEARAHDDAVSNKLPCPGETPMGQSPATPESTRQRQQAATSNAPVARTAADFPPIATVDSVPEGYVAANTGRMSIDFDGMGRENAPANDTYLPGLSYGDQYKKLTGKSLNGDEVPFVVANRGSGLKMGQTVYLKNENTGKIIPAIIADQGPANIGRVEMSPAAARATGATIYRDKNGRYLNAGSNHKYTMYTQSQPPSVKVKPSTANVVAISPWESKL